MSHADCVCEVHGFTCCDTAVYMAIQNCCKLLAHSSPGVYISTALGTCLLHVFACPVLTGWAAFWHNILLHCALQRVFPATHVNACMFSCLAVTAAAADIPFMHVVVTRQPCSTAAFISACFLLERCYSSYIWNSSSHAWASPSCILCCCYFHCCLSFFHVGWFELLFCSESSNWSQLLARCKPT
jgi:hypothetical protein